MIVKVLRISFSTLTKKMKTCAFSCITKLKITTMRRKTFLFYFKFFNKYRNNSGSLSWEAEKLKVSIPKDV